MAFFAFVKAFFKSKPQRRKDRKGKNEIEPQSTQSLFFCLFSQRLKAKGK